MRKWRDWVFHSFHCAYCEEWKEGPGYEIWWDEKDNHSFFLFSPPFPLILSPLALANCHPDMRTRCVGKRLFYERPGPSHTTKHPHPHHRKEEGKRRVRNYWGKVRGRGAWWRLKTFPLSVSHEERRKFVLGEESLSVDSGCWWEKGGWEMECHPSHSLPQCSSPIIFSLLSPDPIQFRTSFFFLPLPPPPHSVGLA